MNSRKAIGNEGESLAIAFLEQQYGYRIVDTNVRMGHKRDGWGGELDIVAWDGDTLCFVEVKTRTMTADIANESPADAVTRTKQLQISRLALAYAQQQGILDVREEIALRFDIVAVQRRFLQGIETMHCELFRAAFYPIIED